MGLMALLGNEHAKANGVDHVKLNLTGRGR
jgi:hypothetical protein